MTRTHLMSLPLSLERYYGLFGKRLVGHAHEVGLAAVSYHLACLRPHQDTSDEELDEEQSQALLAALAALGISFETILDERRLRRALRRVGRSADLRVKQQLANALGRPVSVDTEAEIDRWIVSQTQRISKLVDRAFAGAVEAIEEDPEDFNVESLILALAAEKDRQERIAFTSAAAGLLLLNSALVTANAVAVGLESYVWRTEGDERVREHHADLEGTVQRFDAPPPGGGTTSGDVGNPGEGLNCRCIAEIIVP